jgi:integrase
MPAGRTRAIRATLEEDLDGGGGEDPRRVSVSPGECGGAERGRDPAHHVAAEDVEHRVEEVPDPHPHRFRHTYATNLLEAGQDIRLVQAFLDHEDLNTTLYAKVTDARLAGAVAALPSFQTPTTRSLTGPAFVPQPEQAN